MHSIIFVTFLAVAVIAINADTFIPSLTTPVPIIRRKETHKPDGQFTLDYLTGDGITVEEEGHLVPLQNEEGETVNVLVKSGKFSYTSPEGKPISASYIADQFGFRILGDHLPVAPKALF